MALPGGSQLAHAVIPAARTCPFWNGPILSRLKSADLARMSPRDCLDAETGQKSHRRIRTTGEPRCYHEGELRVEPCGDQ